MKIQTLTNLYPPHVVGGYEVLCFDVMRRLTERAHQASVLTSNYGDGHADYPKQKIFRRLELLAPRDNIYAPFRASEAQRDAINRRNVAALREILSHERPDVVFVWNLHFLAPSFLEAIEQANVPTVYLLTDNWLAVFHHPDFVADYFSRLVYKEAFGLKGFLKSRMRRLMRPQKKQVNKAGVAVFPSRFMRNLYRQAGLTFGRDTVIHHGILPSPQASSNNPMDRSRFIRSEELRLLVAGRIVPIKGVHTAIEAMPKIMKSFPKLRVSLKIIGDDRDRPYLDRLKKQIRELELDDKVSFAPPVPEAELPRLFQNSDVYLFPSLYEPFSLTLIHALRAGIPTVASRAGGTPEIVHHRNTGMLFEASNPVDLARQVICLAENPALRSKVSIQGQQDANQLTFDRMVDQIEACLLSTCRGRS
jgi:glycogen synthase